MSSHAKASAGSVWIAAGIALVFTLLLFGAASDRAAAATGRPYLETIPTAGEAPGSLSADGAGNLYLANSVGGNGVLEKLGASGNAVNFTASASYIDGNKLLYGAGDTAVSNLNGFIYLDRGGEVSVFAPSGEYLGLIPSGPYGCGVGVDPNSGDVYRSGLEDQIVTRHEAVGSNPVDFVLTGRLKLLPGYNGACRVKVDSTGAIYVSTNEGRLVKFAEAEVSPATGPMTTAAGTILTNLNGRATALAVEQSSDNVFADVFDHGYEYGPGGALLAQYNALGGSNGAAFTGGKLLVSRVPGGILVFGGLTQLPIAKTEAASDVLPKSATLHGEVDPDSAGNVTGCEFKYGTDQRYAAGSVPCDTALPIASATAVDAQLSGLDPVTTYHFQLVVENGNGVQLGPDQTVTTPPAVESLNTGEATDIDKTTATLHGSFVGRGEDVHYYFEYGTSSSYGQTVPALPGNDAGSAPGQQDVAVPVSGLQGGTEYHYRVVATNVYGQTVGEDRTFTTTAAVTNLTADPATGITNTSAELNASFDADSHETSYFFEWGTTTAYGNKAPLPPGNSVPAGSGRVSVPPVTISGLKSGLTYHYRVVAANATGTTASADAAFRTAEAPLVNGLRSRNLQATSADIEGEVNPRLAPTTYRFEWGPTASYGNVTPVPDGDVGSGNEAVTVSAHLEGLTPGVTYHFRLVASNEYGTTTSVDQTFGFYPANCPNAQLRQETRSDQLPDCRAYELVSPSFAQGAIIFPLAGPVAPLATSPSRVSFTTGAGLLPEETGGSPANVNGDLYVAARSDTGWHQRFVGRNVTETLVMGGPPRNQMEGFLQGNIGPQSSQRGVQGDPFLTQIADYDRGYPEAAQYGVASNAPYVWDTTSGAQLDRWPTNLAGTPGGEGFVGVPEASADFSHFVFQSNVIFAAGGSYVERSIVCCPGPLAKVPPASIYDNDLKTREVRLASVKTNGEGFEGNVLAISGDGSRILMAEETPDPEGTRMPPGAHVLNDVKGPLYLRIDGARTAEIAPGHQVTFVGSTGDGKTVYLRSKEQLTPDDDDSSTDLYVWRESDEQLTRVSVGDTGNAGNTDECGAITWNGGGCNVEIIDFLSYSGLWNGSAEAGFQAGQGGDGSSDSAIASKNGDIYFISPEQLIEGKGEPGKANLYLFRNGTLRFAVALDPQPVCTTMKISTGCALGPVARMQVTPDGEHMAFVASANVTGYDSAGHTEMYTFDPGSGRVTCASCRLDGLPPTGEVLGSQKGLFQTYDGRVFFSTPDPLVPRDTNEVQDVYEFTEGRARLISAGLGAAIAGFNGFEGYLTEPGLVTVSANGTDVYFATIDSLVTQDHNGAALKIYDARTGGGFPAELTPAKCTAADECHGAGAIQPALPPDRTSAGLGKRAKPKAHKAKKHRKQKAHKKKHKHKRAGKKAKARKAGGKQGRGNRG